MASAPASQPAPKFFDVGSKGGFYEQKSPKMILHEWCVKEKRPTPKFKTTQGEDGSWTCRVVLPDPKHKSENDLLIKLPDDLRCADETEAQYRASVVMLHRVQGDRALERILPAPYVPLWHRCGEDKKKRDEIAAKRAAQDERQREMERRQREKELERGPQVVHLTEGHRRAIEEALQLGTAAPAATPEAEDNSLDASDLDVIIAQLASLGFREDDARSGITAALAKGASGEVLEAALDWLCLHLPEERLPAQYGPGTKSGKPITVRRIAGGGGGWFGSLVARLVAWGWDATTAAEALDASLRKKGVDPGSASKPADGTALQSALEGSLTALYLASLHAHGLRSDVTKDEGHEDEPPSDEWGEEREALEAIFGPDVDFVSPRWTTVRYRTPDPSVWHPSTPEAIAGGGDGVGFDLHVYASPEGSYPSLPPVLAVEAVGMKVSASALQALTKTLAARSYDEALVGAPQIYELFTVLQETLAAMDADGSLWQTAAPKKPARASPSTEDAPKEPKKTAKAPKPAKPRSRLPPPPSAEEVRAESERLATHLQEVASSTAPQRAAMRRTRQSLPAFSKRGDVLAAVGASRVCVLSGATGCGKSTQVPQFVLEDLIQRGAGGSAHVIVTQPRRISAVSLAQRVANEFGEEGPGKTVGYSVRLESKFSRRHTRLSFCTIGILLKRMLEGDPDLRDVTHVVVDEVHERSIDCDLLLLLLRDVLHRNKRLRVILMSATAEAEVFAKYFAPVLKANGEPASSRIDVPGFTYPTRPMFLEEALTVTGFTIARGPAFFKWAKMRDGGKKKKPAAADKLKTDKPERGDGSDSELDPDEEEDLDAPEACKSAAAKNAAPPPLEGPLDEDVARSLEIIDEAKINYDLIEELVCHVIERERLEGDDAMTRGWKPAEEYRDRVKALEGGSSILIFLPGAEEINKMIRQLQASNKLQQACRGGDKEGKKRAPDWDFRLYPLHGSLPPSQQTKVFERVPRGVKKIVVSTNVAETSVTLDDITCVIDSGRHKEVQYDPARNMGALKETWVSRAAATQRQGRAGRVRPGVCFRLFSRATWASGLADHQTAEMLRSPLESTVLRVKAAFDDRSALQCLTRVITPPSDESIAAAVEQLKRMRALDEAEGLTPLGRHLVRMPMDPVVAKMVIYGAMLRCLDPILTVAAVLSYGKSIFFEPPDKRAEVAAIRKRFSGTSKSDHIAVVAAYEGYAQARRKGGRTAAGIFASDNFLSEQALDAVRASRADFARTLAEMGFVEPSYATHIEDGAAMDTSPGSPDEFSQKGKIIKACVAAGAYPNLVRVQLPRQKYAETLGGTVEKDAEAKQIRFFTRKGRVFLHPASVNFTSGAFESTLLVYTELFETSKAFVRESSMAPMWSILLFGGRVAVDAQKQRVVVDDWIEFQAPGRVGVMVRALRDEVERLMALKVEEPTADLRHNAVIRAMHSLLLTEGL